MTTETLNMDSLNISGTRLLADLKPAVQVKAGMIRRFRRWAKHLIEESDWDDRILKMEKRIDVICWAALLAAAICILPAVIRALL